MEKAVSDFIEKHEGKPSPEIALLLCKNKELPSEFIINQINGRKKAKAKFPFLTEFPDYIYPNQRALAQASSEKAASYKSNILKARSVLDLSGGMGLDSYFFSKHSTNSTYVELNPALAKTTQSNFASLNTKHINVENTSAEDFLQSTNKNFELIYIDPDRKVTKEKAFKINECEPNVAQLLPLIWERTDLCMIKLSPMLDISQALSELENCREIHVVSVDNDCKELLFLLEKNYTDSPLIKTVNIRKQRTESFDFKMGAEESTNIQFSAPLNYLYEPNSSIMKSGAFHLIASQFELYKLATNTHLYTSEKLVDLFPGRTLKVEKVDKPQKKFIDRANIVTRNIPLTVEQIKKKYKIKEGGSSFLYACRLQNEKAVFILSELV